MYVVIAVVVVVGLYKAWTMGANDFANSMGGAVGSKSITIRQALILGALCEFAGAVLVGSNVADTIRKGIVEPSLFASRPEVLAVGMGCALLASSVWMHLATWWGMPVSSTHAIVGAVAGFGIVAAGFSAVHWGEMGQIALSWLVSPVSGFVISFTIFKLIARFILGRQNPVPAAVRGAPVVAFTVVLIVALATIYDGLKHLTERGAQYLTGVNAIIISVGIALVSAIVSRFLVARYLKEGESLPLPEQLRKVEMVFAPLVVLSACSVAFAHGANDVANAIGPLAAVVDIVQTGTVQMKVFVPFWALALGGVGIVLGLVTFGYRVLLTIGTKITQLTPSRGVAANIATAATVLVCTRMGLPMSTSHTIVGAVLGVGFARGLGAINEEVTKDILYSWLVTVPFSGVLAMALFVICRFAGLDVMLKGVLQAGSGC